MLSIRLPIRIRLALPLTPEFIEMALNPVYDFTFLVAVELTMTYDDFSILQGKRNPAPLTHYMNMGDTLTTVVTIVTMNVVGNSIRRANRHKSYLQKIFSWYMFQKETYIMLTRFCAKVNTFLKIKY